jgi:hypothetical protein
MSVDDLISVRLLTALAPYAWPITVLILASMFRSRIKELIELKFGDKVSISFGSASSDRKLEQITRERPERSASKELSPSSGPQWSRVGNVFWLGGDLIATAQTSLRGAPKGSIRHALAQAHHHISELGLAESDPAREISLLQTELASLPETSLDRAWRDSFAGKIYRITGKMDVLLREQQPGYRPNAQS